MKALVQRVTPPASRSRACASARSARGCSCCSASRPATSAADLLACKIAALRIFEDAAGKMSPALQDVGGAILAISQLTLAADLRKGNRPSFIRAAPPEVALPLYDHVCTRLREAGLTVATGRFGAPMAVHLTNDGPVTLWLDSAGL